jgi:hypothetical protein
MPCRHGTLPDDVESAVREFVSHFTGADPGSLVITARSIAGGLESDAVFSVSARFSNGRQRCFNFVAKVLRGNAVREGRVYLALASSAARAMSPRLYAAADLEGGRRVLFLQRVRRARSWPWRDVDAAGSILDALAVLHQSLSGAAGAALSDWDYDAELAAHSLTTLELLERARADPSLSALARALPALRRIVSSLSCMRGQLLGEAPTTAVHGDVHPGNVMLRRTRAGTRPVLIDWARARPAAPLEDVHSWLHSLGFWEPEARRRHDTLVARYLSKAGRSPLFDSDQRGAYWLAGASNAMAGVLVHYLSLLLDPQQSSEARGHAYRASQGWLRVVRRADAYWS